MKTFLKMLLATILGGILLIFIGFIILASFASLAEKEVKVADNSIIKVDLNKMIYDRAIDNPFASFDPLSGQPESALGIDEVLASLKTAKTDDRIIGVYLAGGIPITGNASLKEFREAINHFKESGKFVYAYSEVITQKGLYLTSAADSVFVNPEGFIEWSGLNASVTYMKDGLEKLGLQPEVLRATGNKFKSAVEPFLRQDMSDENRLQLKTLMSSLWSSYLADVSASTGLETEKLNQLADELTAINPREAAASGIINATVYEDEIMDILKERSDVESTNDINFISMKQYAQTTDLDGKGGYSSDKIAVVFAQGDIVDGEGDDYSIGSKKIAKAIRKARNNKSVKAIVLRVNSPGGSALASEVIWREVSLAREEKPLIASMGDYAASGGYYICSYADTIIAQSNTITGSIGAFGLFFTGQELLNNKMGLNIETVKTNQYSDLGTFDRPLTESERAILIRQVDQIYNTFKERVAEGRNMDINQVDSIGQGRVWSGEDALKLGLVDMLGGLDMAIALAAEKAGIAEDYRVVKYPELEDPITRLLKEFGGDFEARILKNRLGELSRYFEVFEKAQNMQGYQTRMEYDIIID